MDEVPQMRVLYSFPHKLGAGRICWTAWQQVLGLHAAGVKVIASVGCAARRPPGAVRMFTTLGIGRVRVPYRIFGVPRMSRVHDLITSLWLRKNWREVDIVHAWPLGALHTIAAARDVGVPVVLERPNCHTAFAYQAVEDECRRLGVVLPDGYEHKFDARLLAHEEREYAAADFLLCPSDFVRRTFRERGFSESKLIRHRYGYDDSTISPGNQNAESGNGLVAIYGGLGTPRKGLHHALSAWLASDASQTGKFIVCGEIIDVYREKLAGMLAHPSVEYLGHRKDLPELMKQADLFLLPSMEEGSALVTYEARGAGCVLLVSDAAGAVCRHGEDGLVHPSGDVGGLVSHLNLLEHDRGLLASLRRESLMGIGSLSWMSAGTCLKEAYRDAINLHSCVKTKAAGLVTKVKEPT